MEISESNIIGQLVAADYRAAGVFKKYGIDFCCQGNRTIEDACNKKKLDSTAVVEELNNALRQSGGAESVDFQSWPSDLLVDYIEKKHHRYVEAKTPEIKAYLHKIVRVHGENNPELAEIESLFLATAGALAAHMKKEELILFPFIKHLANSDRTGNPLPAPHFGTVENPIAMMHHEHDVEGERFREIARLTDNYTPPAHACNTYKVCFALLKEFESDLHMHIHLENNILFPAAIRMEEKLMATNIG